VRMNQWPVKPRLQNLADEHGWTWQLAVPLGQLLPDAKTKPGDGLYVNFLRSRRPGTSLSWSPIFTESYLLGVTRMGRVFVPGTSTGALPVNGTFEPGDAGLPRGWVHNTSDWAKPFGKVSVSTDAGVRYVRLASSTKATHLYFGQGVPARRGDVVTLTFSLRGTERGGAGLYLYDADGVNRYIGSPLTTFAVNATAQQRKIVVPITDRAGKPKTGNVRVVLVADPGATVEFADLKATVGR